MSFAQDMEKAYIQQISKICDAYIDEQIEEGKKKFERLTTHFKSPPLIDGKNNKDNTGIVFMRGQIIKWMNDGTGIYGPRRQRIRPKNAKYLRFKYSSSNRRGTKPRDFNSSPSPIPDTWATVSSVRGQEAGKWNEELAKYLSKNSGRLFIKAAKKVR